MAVRIRAFWEDRPSGSWKPRSLTSGYPVIGQNPDQTPRGPECYCLFTIITAEAVSFTLVSEDEVAIETLAVLSRRRIPTSVPAGRAQWYAASVIFGGKTRRLLCFIESQLFFCCFLLSDVHLVFASPIPHGELIRFLAQCGQFTLTCRGSAGHIGTSSSRLDSPSACFIYSRRY